MMLSVHLLMQIYQGGALSSRLNADVLIINASGSYGVGRTLYRIYHLNGLSVKRRRHRKVLATERFLLLRPDALNLGWRQDYNESRTNPSLDYQTPAECAVDWRDEKYDEKSTVITN